jgi:hypothetical protein
MAYALVYAFEYLLVDLDGKPVSRMMSFATFVDGVIRSTTISYRFETLTGPLGPGGYALAALNGLGFFFGGFGVYSTPTMRLTACSRCGRYMPAAPQITGYGTPQELTPQFAYARRLLSEGNSPAATAVINKLSRTDSDCRIALAVASCSSCHRENYRLQLQVFKTPLGHVPLGAASGASWKTFEGFDVTDQVQSIVPTMPAREEQESGRASIL